jgi:hypothetical protein
MHSNFITPPDFVDEQLPNITVVNATPSQVEMLARMCSENDEQYNIYLYHSEMNDMDWLNSAIERSEAVVTHTIDPNLDSICLINKTYYYGDRIIITDATEVHNLLHYFEMRKNQTK